MIRLSGVRSFESRIFGSPNRIANATFRSHEETGTPPRPA